MNLPTLDLVGLFHAHGKKSYSLKREPLAQALKLRRGETVVDASCGSGKDSVLLLRLGARVVAYERHGPLFEALERAHAQALTSSYGDSFERLRLVFGQAHHARPVGEKCYFDPMYPEVGKRRAPNKTVVLLKEMLGEGADGDQGEVLEDLRRLYRRVVLKRPLKAPALARPHYTLRGHSVRYDTYINVSWA